MVVLIYDWLPRFASLPGQQLKLLLTVYVVVALLNSVDPINYTLSL